MSGLMLLGLIAFGAAFLPFLGNNDDDATDETPETDPDMVNGTDGDDILMGLAGQTVNGGAGNDEISAESPANDLVLNGGDGNDTLTAGYAFDDDGFESSDNVVLNGGAGDDELDYFGGSATLDGGMGDDLILSENFPSGDAASDINGGAGNDTISVNGEGGNIIVAGDEGNDLITVAGDLDSVSGGSGDDTLIGTLPDFGEALSIDGGAGDDLIRFDNAAGFHVQNEINGGDGDDTITSDLLLLGQDAFHVLTGGDGADSFELKFTDIGVVPGLDAGLVSVITDFDSTEDMLVVDPATLFEGVDIEDFTADDYTTEVELTEAEDGSYTDVAYTISADGIGRSMTGTIRLEGVTGLTEDALVFVTGPATTFNAAGAMPVSASA